MTSGTSATPGVAAGDAGEHERYRAERDADVASRARLAAVLAILSAASGIASDAWLMGRDLGPRIAPYGLLFAVGTLGIVVLSRPAGRRAARGMALGLVGAAAVALSWLVGLDAAQVDVSVAVFSASMLTCALLLPWGAGSQTLASAVFAVAYLGLPRWAEYTPERTGIIAIALADGFAVSIVGAYLVDRARRSVFRERERVATARDQAVREREEACRIAGQRALLLRASRELGETIELSALADRGARVARELLGAETAVLLLVDGRRDVVEVAAVASDVAARRAAVGMQLRRAADVPMQAFVAHELLDTIDTPSWRTVLPTETSAGPAHTLVVAIGERRSDVLGVLACLRPAAAPPFGADERALADGLRHQAATALANARLVDALGNANRVKAEFVSTMSHELRTPLHVIMGYAEMLDDLEAAPRASAVERIMSAGRDLLELVDSTLDLNRLEAGQDAPRVETISVPLLWAELEAEFAVVARRATVRLVWQPPPPVELATDRRKLRIILKNLVGNALKYTVDGEVRVVCRATDEHCAFAVEDSGIGIPPDQLVHVFDMFRQVDGSDTRSFGGVGLGLYIVKRLADQLGGSVCVDSRVGQGTTFTATLPRALCDQRADAAAPLSAA